MNRPLEDHRVRALADAAASAPSMHNAQPWHFRYARASNTFRVYADFSRAMPEADPDGRGLRVGCGAALFNLRVAAAHEGLATATELLPDPHDEGLLAVMRIGAGGETEGDLSHLHPGIRIRHTSRYPFDDKQVPADVRSALAEAASREGVTLTFPEGWHLQWVLELAQDAAARDRADPRRDEELRRWTHLGAAAADTATEGVPEYAFGPRKRGGRAPVRDFAGGRRTADLGTVRFEEHPQIALLATRGDRPADWLRTGQAMQRVLLLATLNGLASSFFTEVLEWTDTRWPLRDPLSVVGSVQMMLRLGYGPQGPRTPRRPLPDVLGIEPGRP